jgi:hypothetical protein
MNTQHKLLWTIVGVAVVPLLAAGCWSGGDTESLSGDPVTPASTRPQPTRAATSLATPPAGAATRSSTSPRASASHWTDLPDGRHAVLIKRADAIHRQVTVDVIQLFLGDDAARAAAEDHAAEVPPPNDIWTRNESPKLRTLPVASRATITVNVHGWTEYTNTGKDAHKSLDQFAAIEHLDDGMFWLTLTDGRVTRIAEQFLP